MCDHCEQNEWLSTRHLNVAIRLTLACPDLSIPLLAPLLQIRDDTLTGGGVTPKHVSCTSSLDA